MAEKKAKEPIKVVAEEPIKGVTESGFAFEIAPEVLDDLELVDMLYEVDNGDITKLSAFLTRMLGDGQKKRLYEHVRKMCGYVSGTQVNAEIASMFNVSAALKKSEP